MLIQILNDIMSTVRRKKSTQEGHPGGFADAERETQAFLLSKQRDYS